MQAGKLYAAGKGAARKGATWERPRKGRSCLASGGAPQPHPLTASASMVQSMCFSYSSSAFGQ